MTAPATTETTRDTVSATIIVEASPAEIFDYLRRPGNHDDLSGDGSVQGSRVGPDTLDDGDRFGMSMKMFGVPYRITSKVVEFEQDRLIAWCHLSGHRWRWTIESAGERRSRVTETFDLSTARFPPGLRLLGYPARHEANLARSVANVATHFAQED
jgi:hypothetical protein